MAWSLIKCRNLIYSFISAFDKKNYMKKIFIEQSLFEDFNFYFFLNKL